MAKKYIDAEKLKAFKEALADIIVSSQGLCTYDACKERSEQETPVLLGIINSLQQDQPEFPTTDEEIEIFLATHPKVEVPNKYKTPDWLWKKQEQPEVELEEEMEKVRTGHSPQVLMVMPKNG